MAAELENTLQAESELIQSSGGVFEIERDGTLIFSKKAAGRFPEEGEVLQIVWALDKGVPLAEAQQQAGATARKPPGFGEWLQGLIGRRRA